MAQEFETQVLEINVPQTISKLRALGASEEAETMQKRWVFEIHPLGDPTGKEDWIRLRENKGKATITYKNKKGTGVDETDEIEFTVSNFDKASEVLKKIEGFKGMLYQETKRHKFVLQKIEFTIDTWPKIPALLEIEAKSEEEVKKGLALLGLTGKDAGHLGMVKIFQKYGLDLRSFKELRFE